MNSIQSLIKAIGNISVTGLMALVTVVALAVAYKAIDLVAYALSAAY